MLPRTKIICTIGPSVSNYEMIEKLIDAGMNVARLNFSHGTHDEHLEVIKNLKKAREKKGVSLGIMLDTKGPEVRIKKFKNGFISIEEKQKALLTRKDLVGDEQKIPITHPEVIDQLKKGMKVLFDDGYIAAIVVEINQDGALIEFLNGGVLKDKKKINIPHEDFKLPPMTDQDLEDLKFGCENGVDFIAASFICSAEHVEGIKRFLIQQGHPEILVISKIENVAGVKNFDSILQMSDGIMVARGDLGVEMPLTQVPRLQKMMIRKCYELAKPVVTATQMLESMILNPRPTRAEVSDVANAIYDSTSAVMLSGETAVGKYPIECVNIMRAIIIEAEKDFESHRFTRDDRKHFDISSTVALAAVNSAESSKAKAIFAFTNSGFTSRMISRFRPCQPIMSITPLEKTFNQLSLIWGAVPVLKKVKNITEGFEVASSFALEKGIAEIGDLVVVSCGAPFGVSGTTNTLILRSIGEVLIRGNDGSGSTVYGEIKLVLTLEKIRSADLKEKILVIPRFDERFIPFLEESLGIILQNHPDDLDSEKSLKEFGDKKKISYLTRADGALSILKNGMHVTLHPQKKLVFQGKIE